MSIELTNVILKYFKKIYPNAQILFTIRESK